MDDYIHIILPVYYTQVFKTKAAKVLFINLNWYRNAHFHIKNEVKQWYTNEVISQLKAANAAKIIGSYELAIKYYYKNAVSDLDNVCAMGMKHFNDAAQAYGLVENDNVKHCIKSCFYVGGQDKKNPRLEIYIRAVREENENNN